MSCSQVSEASCKSFHSKNAANAAGTHHPPRQGGVDNQAHMALAGLGPETMMPRLC